MINRRGLITGLTSFMAAPAIVRAGSLMPVKAIVDYEYLLSELDFGYGYFQASRDWIGPTMKYENDVFSVTGITAEQFYNDHIR